MYLLGNYNVYWFLINSAQILTKAAYSHAPSNAAWSAQHTHLHKPN